MAFRLDSLVGVVLSLATIAGNAFGQQVQPAPKPRPLSEIETAQQAAKTAAGFEFLGTLARTCLLPPSRSEDTRDIPAPYVSDPGKAPARATWFEQPAKVFDNLYFVGGKVHSAWALTTREGIIPSGHDLSIQLGRAHRRRHAQGRARSEGHQVRRDLARAPGPYRRRRDAPETLRPAPRHVRPDWELVEKYPNRFRPWPRSATSWQPTA
jgi:hypothetical protein